MLTEHRNESQNALKSNDNSEAHYRLRNIDSSLRLRDVSVAAVRRRSIVTINSDSFASRLAEVKFELAQLGIMVGWIFVGLNVSLVMPYVRRPKARIIKCIGPRTSAVERHLLPYRANSWFVHQFYSLARFSFQSRHIGEL